MLKYEQCGWFVAALGSGERARLRADAEGYADHLSRAKLSAAQTAGLVRMLLGAKGESDVVTFFAGLLQRGGHRSGGWNLPGGSGRALWADLQEFLTKTLVARAAARVEEVRIEMRMTGESDVPLAENTLWQSEIQEFASYLSGWARITITEVRKEGGPRVSR